MRQLLLLGLLGATLHDARGTTAAGSIESQSQEESTPAMEGPIYQFKYHVYDEKTQDYKTHEEVGKNGLVHGTYTVREPNGDLRVVSYTAGDERGFQAMVRVQPPAILDSESVTLNQATNNGESSDLNEPLKIQLNTQRRAHSVKSNKHQRNITELIQPTVQETLSGTAKRSSTIDGQQLPTGKRSLNPHGNETKRHAIAPQLLEELTAMETKYPTGVTPRSHQNLTQEARKLNGDLEMPKVHYEGTKRKKAINSTLTDIRTTQFMPFSLKIGTKQGIEDKVVTSSPLHVPQSLQGRGTPSYSPYFAPVILHVIPTYYPSSSGEKGFHRVNENNSEKKCSGDS